MERVVKYLVDSNIIIYHLNNIQVATDFLRKYCHEIAISQITYVEVLSFPFSETEEVKVKQLLSRFEIIDITQSISEQAVQNRKVKKIKLPDNLIISTAMINDLIVVTRNTKDFSGFDMNILNIFM